ncbi:MAG TPA: family 16 glycoside hydrolase, partial [Ktedonobacteraceae bacterium]|nr:family 16 glycoside hydrolase [Ktedonobacteraceae bacterium]
LIGGAVGITLLHNQQNPLQTSLTTPPAGNTPTSASGATSTATSGSSLTPTATDTTTPSPADTSTPTSTVTPTPTFANTPIPSNTLLYTSDWSGGFDGWNGDSEWKVSNGMLLSDGNSGSGNNGLINCPYQVPTGDYAIEAQIQTITSSDYNSSGTFIFLRGDGNGGGYYVGIGYAAAVIDNTNYNAIVTRPYNLDNNWHTYRVEARSNGLALYIDGHLFVNGEDNNYITGGQIGINTPYVQTNVRSFKVYSL